MLRREFVVGAGAVAFAGCSGSGSESDGGETPADAPDSPIFQHYQALDANDFEGANAAIHSDSPRGELPDEAIERARTRSYSVDATEVFDGETDTPEVAVTVTETETDSGDSQTLELRIEVRKEDGIWKMYRIL